MLYGDGDTTEVNVKRPLCKVWFGEQSRIVEVKWNAKINDGWHDCKKSSCANQSE